MAKNKFIHLLLACALFTACDNNDTVVDESKAYPAVIVAQAFGYGTTEGSTWSKGETLGVYMLKGGTNDIIAPYSNLRYYANNRTDQDYFLPGNNDSIPYFPASGDKMEIAAYYPQATVLADSLVAIHLINNYAYAAKLLFSRVSDLSKDNRKAVLSLRPILAQLTFKFKVGYGMTEADLKGLTVTLKGLPVSAYFNAITGKFRVREVTTDQTIQLITTEKKATTRAANEETDNTFITAAGMVLPTKSTAGYQVTVKLPKTGKIYQYDIPNGTVDLEGSTNYVFDSKINNENMAVIVQSSPITNWGPGGIINGEGEEQQK